MSHKKLYTEWTLKKEGTYLFEHLEQTQDYLLFITKILSNKMLHVNLTPKTIDNVSWYIAQNYKCRNRIQLYINEEELDIKLDIDDESIIRVNNISMDRGRYSFCINNCVVIETSIIKFNEIVQNKNIKVVISINISANEYFDVKNFNGYIRVICGQIQNINCDNLIFLGSGIKIKNFIRVNTLQIIYDTLAQSTIDNTPASDYLQKYKWKVSKIIFMRGHSPDVTDIIKYSESSTILCESFCHKLDNTILNNPNIIFSIESLEYPSFKLLDKLINDTPIKIANLTLYKHVYDEFIIKFGHDILNHMAKFIILTDNPNETPYITINDDTNTLQINRNNISHNISNTELNTTINKYYHTALNYSTSLVDRHLILLL